MLYLVMLQNMCCRHQFISRNIGYALSIKGGVISSLLVRYIAAALVSCSLPTNQNMQENFFPPAQTSYCSLAESRYHASQYSNTYTYCGSQCRRRNFWRERMLTLGSSAVNLILTWESRM